MNRGPWIYTGLFVLAGVWAYLTWTRAPETAVVTGSIKLWDGRPGDVKSVRLEMEKKTTALVVRPDGSLWVQATRMLPSKAKSPTPTPGYGSGSGSGSGSELAAGAGSGSASPAAAPPALESQAQDYPAGEEAQTLLGRLTPLMALRDLGVVTDEQRTAFGFDKPQGTLIVALAGGERRLELGGRVYGGEDRYVRDAKSGRGYVVEADLVRPLEFPESSLRLRKFHDFSPDVIESARVTAGTRTRELLRRRGKDGAGVGAEPGATPTSPTVWVDATSPDQDNQTLSNFMDRVWSTAPLEFLAASEPAPPAPVVRIEYLGKGGKSLGTFELYEVGAASPDATAGGKYLARSDRTGVLARLPAQVAERLVEDVKQIFAP